jgi:hypothetical protein
MSQYFPFGVSTVIILLLKYAYLKYPCYTTGEVSANASDWYAGGFRGFTHVTCWCRMSECHPENIPMLFDYKQLFQPIQRVK